MLRQIPLPADPDLEGLVPADAPARPRAVAVLDGVLSGRAWVDQPEAPRAVLVIEDSDGTVYGGGPLTADDVAGALTGVPTSAGDLVFGFSGPDDPLRRLVPGEPYWRGEAVDFTDRIAEPDEGEQLAVPLADGAELVRLDSSTLPLTEWSEDTIHAFGSVERWERHGLGFAVMRDGAVVAECVAGPRARGRLEMGVTTREPYRRLGYGTLVSRAVARACEAGGDLVWWNANAGNAASIAIARRIGFRSERRYELVACHAPLGGPPDGGV